MTRRLLVPKKPRKAIRKPPHTDKIYHQGVKHLKRINNQEGWTQP